MRPADPHDLLGRVNVEVIRHVAVDGLLKREHGDVGDAILGRPARRHVAGARHLKPGNRGVFNVPLSVVPREDAGGRQRLPGNRSVHNKLELADARHVVGHQGHVVLWHGEGEARARLGLVVKDVRGRLLFVPILEDLRGIDSRIDGDGRPRLVAAEPLPVNGDGELHLAVALPGVAARVATIAHVVAAQVNEQAVLGLVGEVLGDATVTRGAVAHAYL